MFPRIFKRALKRRKPEDELARALAEQVLDDLAELGIVIREGRRTVVTPRFDLLIIMGVSYLIQSYRGGVPRDIFWMKPLDFLAFAAGGYFYAVLLKRRAQIGIEIPVKPSEPERLYMVALYGVFKEIIARHPRRKELERWVKPCLLYTSPSPRDLSTSRMPSSA